MATACSLVRVFAYWRVRLFACPLIGVFAYLRVRLLACSLICASAYWRVRLLACSPIGVFLYLRVRLSTLSTYRELPDGCPTVAIHSIGSRTYIFIICFVCPYDATLLS